MKHIKAILLATVLVIVLGVFASAIEAPEFYGDISIRAEEPLGMRTMAFVSSSSINNANSYTSEYGFLVTRKIFLKGANEKNEDFTFDSNVFYIKGVAYGIENGERVNRYFDFDDTGVMFAGFFHGVAMQYYREVYVARPYLISGGKTYYGEPVELCLYDEAKKVYENPDSFNSLTDEHKAAVEKIVNAYAPKRENYRIVMSAQPVNNYDGTYSLRYTLLNPETFEIESKSYLGRGYFNTIEELPDFKTGTVLALVDGLVEDLYGEIAHITLENALHIASFDNENGTLSLVKLDDAIKCKDCIREAVSGFDTGVSDIYNTAIPSNTVSFSEDTAIFALYCEKDNLFGGTFIKTSFDRIESRLSDFLCYNYTDTADKVYSDYIKSFVSVDESGKCEYVLIVVNGGENSAIDEKCEIHTPIVYHSVNFYSEGNLCDTQLVEDGSFASLPENPTMDEHKFIGWSLTQDGETVDVASYAVTEDTEFYAVFLPYFMVTFHVDGVEYDNQKVLKGGIAQLPETPMKEYYGFVGWTAGEGGETVDVASYVVTENTDFYAVFERTHFEAVFYVNGEKYNIQMVLDGTNAIVPDAPVFDEHKFIGWSLTQDGEIVDVASHAVTQDTDFYAVFLPYFTVSFHVGGVEYDNQKVLKGGTAQLPETPMKEYYGFVGWTAGEGGETIDVASYVVTENTDFYAVFERTHFEAVFYVNGEKYNSQMVLGGTFASLPENPTMDEHKFIGWSLTQDGEIVDVANYAVTEDTEFYAVFLPYFTVSFHVDGVEYDNQKVLKGGIAQLPETPIKEYYGFVGWTAGEGGEIISVSEYVVEENTDFYAVFERTHYEAVFYVNGEKYNIQMVLDGTNAIVPDAPVFDEHKFIGWSLAENGETVDVASYAVTEDTEFYAVFLPYFTVTFHVDGVEYDNQKVLKGGIAQLPETPIKEYYGFVGWTAGEGGETVDVASYVVTENTDFYAVFERTHFEAVFYVNGEKYDSQMVKKGQNPILPKQPEPDGVTFIGWATTPGAAAGDVVDVSVYAVLEDTSFYAVVEAKQNDPKLVEILTRGNTQLKRIRLTNGSKHDIARDYIVECITYVIEDAQNGIFIDEKYIRSAYPKCVENIRKAIKEDMTETERSNFVNVLRNEQNIDPDVQKFLIDYFNIDLNA